MVSSASGRLLSLRGLAEYHPVNDAATTIISVEAPSDDASPQSVAHGRGSALQALTTLTLVLCVLLTLLWGKQYARHWLLWLDSQDRETVCLVFLIMYTLVAFPLTWGYILLNFACGYHFGLVLGVAVTAGAATFGISVAHTVMKRFFLGFIMARLLSSDVVRSTLALLDTGHAFKVVIISRLTPIPFGLQNAMFAVSQSHMTPTTPPCFSSGLFQLSTRLRQSVSSTCSSLMFVECATRSCSQLMATHGSAHLVCSCIPPCFCVCLLSDSEQTNRKLIVAPPLLSRELWFWFCFDPLIFCFVFRGCALPGSVNPKFRGSLWTGFSRPDLKYGRR